MLEKQFKVYTEEGVVSLSSSLAGIHLCVKRQEPDLEPETACVELTLQDLEKLASAVKELLDSGATPRAPTSASDEEPPQVAN